MKALVIETPFEAVIKEVPYPAPGEDEVTIKVKNVGIAELMFTYLKHTPSPNRI
ncbi:MULTISPECIES: hypothetical protein [Bacillus]|uniref:NADPH:quinone reductase-like Zn-dependent oxidoreductase n=1 Tax=Bacillus capparidis TaxID=1840411 RepID=A0ABS4CZ56_9BACI|nr:MULTISPECIES: hypothetical protein [Bacillus]MBP1082650.1 NADPH:quinone reductase-like Zn-dependent oxidoreductase [Bacillus capparidis]MED1097123.1 hypothetical protein [Bacillus capparidis]